MGKELTYKEKVLASIDEQISATKESLAGFDSQIAELNLSSVAASTALGSLIKTRNSVEAIPQRQTPTNDKEAE